ncbi:MAG: hypothetical protein KKE59_09050, partial [Proteobacteria bacterium]|nr:hypothetical protein [Pseudomonadota bacterium]
LPQYQYKIIFMLRDPMEIEVSYLKMFQRRAPFVLYKYHELMNETLKALNDREGIEVMPVQYRDVICDSLPVFAAIKKKYFPMIDVEKAAAAVNPALYRSRGKDLDRVRQTIPGLRIDLPEFI